MDNINQHRPAPSGATLLVVGAGGFIGGFIVSQAISRGYKVWAGIRKSTSRRYLTDPAINFVEFDYDDYDALEKEVTASAPSASGWDYVIWNLGATKCAKFRDFNRINFEYPRTFINVLLDLGMNPKKFLYMSSLSALGPVAEDGSYAPITNDMQPQPNTRYGLSKIKTEAFLERVPELNWVVFRPTGVYGPHEQDYLMMIKSIESHWDFSVGFKKQMLTFIYVEDLVNAMLDVLPTDVVHKKYIISEDRAYTQEEFRTIVKEKLGVKRVIPVKMPMWLTYTASYIAEKLAAARGKASTLNRDKFKIMKQRNWNCDISDAVRDFGFHPEFPLDRGIEETVKSYLASKKE